MAAPDPAPTPAPTGTPAPAPSTSDVSPEIIERIRKEEKEKLYSEISDLRERLNVAQNESGAKTEEFTRKIAELNEQLSALQKAAKANFDPTAFAREISEDTRRILTEKHTQQVEELNTRLTRLEREKTEATLASIRTKLIADANGKIIPALVRGNTEAELNASAEEAKKEYERIIAQRDPAPTPTPSQAPVPAANPGLPNIPVVVTGQSASDYAKSRKQILASVRAQHG